MWFKNLLLYRFTSPFDHSTEELNQRLEKFAFSPCRSHDTSKYGWVSPMGELSDELQFSAQGRILLCARREEKVLPAAVIREKLDDKVKLIQAQEDRPVSRKEKETLKEEVIFDCLPQAFTRSNRTYGYIDVQNGWLCIDSSSYTKAEEWMKLLRDSLGSLPVVPVQVTESPSVVMTSWLRGEPLPENLLLGDECELREPREDGSIVRCKKQELLAEEIDPHLQAGKQVMKLALHWNDCLQLVLADDLAVKRLKFGEQLVSEAQDSANGDKAAQFDADFALMTGTLEQFIPQLLGYFGNTKADAI
ncbi:recombination-associated protein RdgC [Pseudomaricurvus alcaniphilus]|uniref:recombination-associated protein RdgC n=1 Tax=Pseudomaricurvus alcaniphilus TaxID=1166482 RepID=UPI001409A44A|nr:recombination-associated protein RdgC [Pseudomaricurvus alcaniphilus]NHN39380.1 recombination-associated protein RdgC [Pseudomaricurvus alcaniphilus]